MNPTNKITDTVTAKRRLGNHPTLAGKIALNTGMFILALAAVALLMLAITFVHEVEYSVFGEVGYEPTIEVGAFGDVGYTPTDTQSVEIGWIAPVKSMA